MSVIRVKLDIIHERILDEAIKRKFFKTKNELFNVAVTKLGQKYKMK